MKEVPILRAFGETIMVHYEEQGVGSLFGGVIDEETLKRLGLNTYDVGIVSGCTTNCLDLIGAALRLLIVGQTIYTKSLVRLALEHHTKHIYGPNNHGYNIAKNNVNSASTYVNTIHNKFRQLKQKYLNNDITKTEYQDNENQLNNILEGARNSVTNANIKLISQKLVDYLIFKFGQRDKNVIDVVFKYLNLLSPMIGYKYNYYQFLPGYPEYIIITKSKPKSNN